ncbi:MAG TPA: endonuclease III [Rectinemataceae bacterium]|nr:endonuclease III [Rectinemataceae bacterium]
MTHSNPAVARRLEKVLALLGPLWPDARALLTYTNCFELLCSVILSAQCTDEQVNRVTPALFARWPDPPGMAKAGLAELEEAIRSIGFWKTKARHLRESASMIVAEHGGRVPDTMEKLLTLPGVGRKTANLVLSSCFGRPGIIVDTHVLRVAQRLGIADKADPALVEKIVAANVPAESWTRLSHAINRHGKYVCRARKPDCPACPLAGFCPRKGVAAAERRKPGAR